MRRFLIAAMEQQMWFFGCDAAYADGNLLVRYGFQKYRWESHRGQSSCYRFLWRPTEGRDHARRSRRPAWLVRRAAPGRSRCREGGFLYVRARNRLGWYDAPEPPAPGDYDDDPAAARAFCSLGRRPEPGFCRAAARFLSWVEQYESWIGATCGPGYRRRCFERAPLPWLPPAEARAWLASYQRGLIARADDIPS